jgi:hypothetical protein
MTEMCSLDSGPPAAPRGLFPMRAGKFEVKLWQERYAQDCRRFEPNPGRRRAGRGLPTAEQAWMTEGIRDRRTGSGSTPHEPWRRAYPSQRPSPSTPANPLPTIPTTLHALTRVARKFRSGRRMTGTPAAPSGKLVTPSPGSASVGRMTER